MFSRFSFSISRVLRFKSRRANKAPVTVPVPPPPPPKKVRGQSLRLEPVASPALQSLLSPVAHSPQLSPIPGVPGPIIIIGQDPIENYVVTEKVQHLTPDTVHLTVLEPPRRKRVSFDDQRAESSSPASSSLSPTPVSTTMGVDQVPPKPVPSPIALKSADSTELEAYAWEDVPGSADVPVKRKGEKRPMSLFSPRPTCSKSQRFSVPAVPSRPESMQRRASKRVSAMPPASGAKKEKRQSRWSREMNSVETQEGSVAKAPVFHAMVIEEDYHHADVGRYDRPL
ncbi:hypothetical protein HYDPIDRAFT_32144 [Hydnomerulius pinastri MD-312]|uniref:Uncharacterized protein n=1 Tax=Hydnomerulius pinastri MD-312 TaxID=994086 RepID=A0A0C9WB32_9AGAM|nr:hypothetical protein HYDPIDRAFT_32144 [Hydnomerulius pinastri MD-312]